MTWPALLGEEVAMTPWRCWWFGCSWVTSPQYFWRVCRHCLCRQMSTTAGWRTFLPGVDQEPQPWQGYEFGDLRSAAFRNLWRAGAAADAKRPPSAGQ